MAKELKGKKAMAASSTVPKKEEEESVHGLFIQAGGREELTLDFFCAAELSSSR